MRRSVKRGFLVYWALFMTIVWITNVFSGMKAAGWLSEDWSFASPNFELVAGSVGNLGGPRWLAGLLFIGVILWEGVAALLFWAAAARYGRKSRGIWGSVEVPFIVGFALWGAFVLAGEIFIDYQFNATHMALFSAMALSLMMIRLLPEGDEATAVQRSGVVRTETRTATVTVRRRA